MHSPLSILAFFSTLFGTALVYCVLPWSFSQSFPVLTFLLLVGPPFTGVFLAVAALLIEETKLPGIVGLVLNGAVSLYWALGLFLGLAMQAAGNANLH